MKPIEQLRQDLIVSLENYEERARHYCAKVEQDRPEVADAIWDAVWRHRQRVLQSHEQLIRELDEAKYRNGRD